MLGPLEPHDTLLMAAAPIAFRGEDGPGRGGVVAGAARWLRRAPVFSKVIATSAALLALGLTVNSLLAGGDVAGLYPF